MAQRRKKKAIEYHFVDMNDPNRYKKLKVARACDFCRRRKSKCDIGVPGSGTCSNCKKANHTCIFSPVSSTTPSPNNGSSTTSGNPISMVPSCMSPTNTANIIKKQQQQQERHPSIIQQQQKPQKFINSIHSNNSFTSMYQNQFPFFSMDQRAHCGYERDNNIYSHLNLASTTITAAAATTTINQQDIPLIHSKQIEQELFDTYFTYFHPFFPILDRYYILKSLSLDNNVIPCSLKWAIIAIALSHFSNQLQDSCQIAAIYYQHAVQQVDHQNVSLSTVQTLLLLYKYQEMMTSVGQPITSSAVDYLKEAQSMLLYLKQPRSLSSSSASETAVPPSQQWTTNDEFIGRLEWILFIILSTSNISDKRWKNMLKYSTTPNKFPALTETEQYDKAELNTTCNLIHLINITLLYSQTISLISDQNTLFSMSVEQHDQFDKLATGLNVWKKTLPAHISTQISSSYASTSSSDNNNNTNPSPFTTYICLIYDILDLLLSIHQPSEQHTLSKKALSVCIRAHGFTVGDIQSLRFSRLASIHGSRLISFGLCLALQTQSYYQQIHQSLSQENFYSSFSITFKVLNQLSLSPHLYMTIRTFNNQIESKKQLQQQQQQQQQQFEQQYEHNRNSNSNVTPTITTSSNNSNKSHQTTSSSAVSPSSYVMDLSSYYFNNSHHQGGGESSNNSNSGVWGQQRYPSFNNSNDNRSSNSQYHQQTDNTWNYQYQHQSLPSLTIATIPQEDAYNMPITPTFETPNNHFLHYDHHMNDSSTTIMPRIIDSYFQPQQQLDVTVLVSTGPFHYDSFESFYNTSKSCKNKKMI